MAAIRTVNGQVDIEMFPGEPLNEPITVTEQDWHGTYAVETLTWTKEPVTGPAVSAVLDGADTVFTVTGTVEEPGLYLWKATSSGGQVRLYGYISVSSL